MEGIKLDVVEIIGIGPLSRDSELSLVTWG